MLGEVFIPYFVLRICLGHWDVGEDVGCYVRWGFFADFLAPGGGDDF